MANGIISHDPASSRSDRVLLDNAKVELLKKAAFIKFKVKSDNGLNTKKRQILYAMRIQKANQPTKNKNKLFQITITNNTSFKIYGNDSKYRLKTCIKN